MSGRRKPAKSDKIWILFSILSITAPLLIIGFFVYINLHIFKGDINQAISILGTIIQGMTGIIAVLFAFIILIIQYNIGQYIPNTINYIINQKSIVIIFLFYIISFMTAIYSIWNINSEYYGLYVDICLLLFGSQIIQLLPLYGSISEYLNPRKIIDIISNDIPVTFERENNEILLLFSIIHKLIKNGETTSAIYGVRKITSHINIMTSSEHEYLFHSWVIPHYERLAFEAFKYDPNITENVFIEWEKIIDNLCTKSNFLLTNIGNQISSSSLRISKEICYEPYSKFSLITSYRLIRKIYVDQQKSHPEWITLSDISDLQIILSILNKTNIEKYLITGLDLTFIYDDLLKNKCYKALQLLFALFTNEMPINEHTLLTGISFIIQKMTIDQKEYALKLINLIKNKYVIREVIIKKSEKESQETISIDNNNIIIETKKKNTVEKGKWFE